VNAAKICHGPGPLLASAATTGEDDNPFPAQLDSDCLEVVSGEGMEELSFLAVQDP
jgi:hypothetical protein